MDTLNKHHPLSPNGVDDHSRNESGNLDFDAVLQARMSRRTLLKGSFAAATTSIFGVGLANADGGNHAGGSHAARARMMGFSVVAKNTNDMVTVPEGYTAQVLYRLGDPISNAVAEYMNDGSEDAASFEFRAGDHHDGMHYFGLSSHGFGRDHDNAKRGLLVMNHENISQIFLHSAAENAAGFSTSGRVPAQIDKEVNVHGISVIEVTNHKGNFEINKGSTFNRRITAASLMDISGPARGDDLMVTKFSPDGSQTRGTLNNCAHGYTPWGTYLTCEENWAGYFKRPATSSPYDKAEISQNRYIGSGASNGSYGWANPVGGDSSGSDLYNRWNITPGASADTDFRNAANTMGWVVEVDPYDTDSVPRKRTALGRFGHEGAMPAKVVPGKPLVYYMGDDARGEYVYKYVSNRKWKPSDALRNNLEMGDKYLDDGKLYVATFNADGSGSWTELSIDNPAIAGYAAYDFADQADVLINCRIAADAVGATPMDRPEWTGVHPITGDVYVTMTNNTDRGKTGTFTNGVSNRGLDAANPRYYNEDGSKGNVNGHIIRMREDDRDPAATSFDWDVYLFGAEADKFADANINVSGLTDDNDFSSPDGLWFSQRIPGLMWIQTDDGAYTDITNCMMLAAVPGHYGDGGTVEIDNLAVPSNGGLDQTVTTYVGKPASSKNVRRFLVGPNGCEITGICETPDGKAIFVNVQHPGEDTGSAEVANNTGNFQSHWPQGGAERPRSSTIVITKDDGGVIGS
jgi:secreted PhoX family phosphatase